MLVPVLGVGSSIVACAACELCAKIFKGVRNVFEEDKPQDDMLVFGSVDVLSELVGGLPELFFYWFDIVFFLY